MLLLINIWLHCNGFKSIKCCIVDFSCKQLFKKYTYQLCFIWISIHKIIHLWYIYIYIWRPIKSDLIYIVHLLVTANGHTKDIKCLPLSIISWSIKLVFKSEFEMTRFSLCPMAINKIYTTWSKCRFVYSGIIFMQLNWKSTILNLQLHEV